LGGGGCTFSFAKGKKTTSAFPDSKIRGKGKEVEKRECGEYCSRGRGKREKKIINSNIQFHEGGKRVKLQKRKKKKDA